MTTILTVCNTAEWPGRPVERRYGPEHVVWLQRQVQRWAPSGTRFLCLSDTRIPGVGTLPLTEGWPGWWSKMELFQHDLGPVLYLDLDTVIVGPLHELLAHPHHFTTFSAHPDSTLHLGQPLLCTRILCSGVMAWSGARRDLFEIFRSNPQHWMQVCTSMPYCWGDQGFLRLFLEFFETWEELFPGAVGSYKREFQRGTPPPSARIITFEGAPKPWEVQADWIPQLDCASLTAAEL